MDSEVMAASPIFVGTAGWSYPDWAGAVYPRSGPSTERLRTVAEYLDCVEVDSSFYRPPTARMAANWVRTVTNHPDFRFLAKAWQRFTHDRTGPWSRAEFDLFAQGVSPLRDAGRLEALLFQFPWSFRNLPENRDWLKQIAEWFADWPVAVEVRHDSWLGDDVPEFFRSHRFTYCNIDQPARAHCLPPGSQVTSDIGYFRLHGRNAQNWFRDQQEAYGGRYDYLYSGSELDDMLGHIRRIAAQAKKTFVVFNNHKDAKAFANALQVKVRVQPGATVRAPAALLVRFPSLRTSVRSVGQEQLPLG
ncbi:MAG TPA: DUF72 domain-containing protein [Verrucomicrobiae bacterium]|nr:DUF72 domain-containing protein [Verrucomicrobiae bacterium]